MFFRSIVQLVERRSPKPNVMGSSPITPVFCVVIFYIDLFFYKQKTLGLAFGSRQRVFLCVAKFKFSVKPINLRRIKSF